MRENEDTTLTIRSKIKKLVWDVLEKNSNLKKVLYKFYDRFWQFEKIFGIRDKNIIHNQSDEYLIDIDRVKFVFSNFDHPNLNPKRVSKIKNLNIYLVKIEDLEEYKLVKEHFLDNLPWKDTKSYNFFNKSFYMNKKVCGFTIEEQFLTFLKTLDNVYLDLKKSNNNINKYEIKVGIREKGDFILVEGIFYYAIIKLLNIHEISVKVVFRNQKWIDFKKDLLNYLSFHQDIYQPLLHPDLKSIKTSYTEERFKIIKDNLHVKSGTVLDIGANFGFFCHKFEELGYKCNAVEIRPRNVYFMKKLRNIEEKKFKIINKSIFDLEEPLEFDIVLALNIFHHFLKEKDLFEELINFLGKLKVKEMFFQPHSSEGRVSPNSYTDFKPKEFVEFVMKNAHLSKYQLIAQKVEGDTKERPIYRIFN